MSEDIFICGSAIFIKTIFFVVVVVVWVLSLKLVVRTNTYTPRTASQILLQPFPLCEMALQLAVKNALKRGERVIFDRGKHVLSKHALSANETYGGKKMGACVGRGKHVLKAV